jgi:hypothetical protein
MAAAPVPLSDVLGRTADEVRRCREIVLRIETAAHHLLDGAELRPGLRADLQAIDLLDQRLDDLGTWLAALAEATADARLPGPVAGLLHALRLADLREALAGAPPPKILAEKTELF